VSSLRPLEDILEKEWASDLFSTKRGLAPSLGWRLTYHTQHSQSSRSGFPDQVLIRDRIIFVELKREKTKPTDNQIEFLDGLTRAGGEVYVWRPSDLEEIGLILSKRWVFIPRTAQNEGGRLHQGENFWVPGSAWVCGHGRADTLPVVDDGQTTLDDFVAV